MSASFRILRAALALAAAATLALPGAATADVPPPDDYVEQCTLEKAKQEGEECLGRSSWHGDTGVASRFLASYGFCRRCKTYGASAWSEIYCRPASGAKPLPATWEADVAAQEKAQGDAAERSYGPECPLTERPAGTTADSPATNDPPATKATRTGCGCVAVGAPDVRWALLASLAAIGALWRRRSRR